MKPNHVALAAVLALCELPASPRPRTNHRTRKTRAPKASRPKAKTGSEASYPRCACGQLRNRWLPACRTCLKKNGGPKKKGNGK